MCYMQENSIESSIDWTARLVAFVVAVVMVTSGFVMLAPDAAARSGGPDAKGYTYKDSAESTGPTYNWVDIVSSGSKISDPSDYVQGPYTLPWTFTMYDVDRTQWWIGGDNGWLTLGNPGVPYDWTGKRIPSTAINTALIAPMWNDWQYCTGASGIYSESQGTTGNRVFIIQFEQLRQWAQPCTNTVTYEVLMYEATGNIVFQYKDNTAQNFYGASSAGIQESGALGLSYAFGGMNGGYYAGRAVEFYAPPPPVNEVEITSVEHPDPISLADDNVFSADIKNKGSNTQTDVDVNMEIFTTNVVTVIDEDFSDYDTNGDVTGWTHGIFSGTRDGWGAGNDEDTWNRGIDSEDEDGEWDGEAMSAGRKGSGASYPGQLELAGLLTDGPYDVDAKNGKLYVANYFGGTGNCGEVVIIDATTQTLDAKYSPSGCYRPRAVTADDEGNVYFITYGSSNARMYKLSYDSGTDTYTYAWYKQHTSSKPLYYAQGIAFDNINDEILVSTGWYYNAWLYITRWDPDGDYINKWSSALTGCTTYSGGNYHYCRPMGIETATVGTETHVFVSYYSYRSQFASDRGRVTEFTTSGSKVTDYFNSNAPGAYSLWYYKFNYHYDVATDGDGNIYFGAYYGYYSGIAKCEIGTDDGYPGSCSEGIPYGQIYPGHNYYTYGIAADSNYIYRSSYGYDTLEVHAASDGAWVKTIGAMAYDSWLRAPSIDMTSSMGGTLTFSHSWGMYFTYEGAFLEGSTDGGTTWDQIDGFAKGGYYQTPMVSTYNNPYGGQLGWAYYSFGNSQDMYWRTTGDNNYDYKWGNVELDLGPWAGETLDLRWRVGYCTYWYWYYNGWYRLDDVQVDLTTKAKTAMDETETISSIAYKESKTVTFDAFKPDASSPDFPNGLKVGDVVGIEISITDEWSDEDTSNNKWTAFLTIKYVMFSEGFENGLTGGAFGDWDISYEKFGGDNIWGLDSKANTGSNALYSGKKADQSYPGVTGASTPSLDLSLPVDATLTFSHNYRFYYNYDGLIVEISQDGGTTWDEMAPSDRGDGQAGYKGGYWSTIGTYMANPYAGKSGWTYYGLDGFPMTDDFRQVAYDLTPYVGNDDVKVRWSVGWNGYYYAFYGPYGYWLDDVTVTGLVYSNNIAVPSLDLVDPIPVDGTPDIGIKVLNAGAVEQLSGKAKVRLQIGPYGTQTIYSEDHESHTSMNDHPWEATNVATGGTGSWGTNPGFYFPAADADGGKGWGHEDGEIAMYYGGGDGYLTMPALDLSDAADDAVMTVDHRYRFVWYQSQGTAYNGGRVEISTNADHSDPTQIVWTPFIPEGGYPGTVFSVNYGHTLYGQDGFVKISGGQSFFSNGGQWVTDSFALADYVGEDSVWVRFHFGMYSYLWPGDGEQWAIDEVAITGTGMESVLHTETWGISGSGTGGAFASGESKDITVPFHFSTPGMYKIKVDSWIEGYVDENGVSAPDEYPGDNDKDVNRETMFTVSFSDAEEEKIRGVNAKGGNDYVGGWSTGIASDTTMAWVTSTNAFRSPAHGWSGGDDVYGYPNGDDISLYSPKFDLSQAVKAKFVFMHTYAFYESGVYYYDGGRVEISTNGGTTWNGLAPSTSSAPLKYAEVYNLPAYANPLSGQKAFVGGSGGWVETQIRLDTYTGPGMDDLQLRFHLGGSYPDWNPIWYIDDIGLYALGFDLTQTTVDMPYRMDVGAGASLTTNVKNVGMGNLGDTGLPQSTDIYAYANDMDGNTVWSHAVPLTSLDMGTSTGTTTIALPAGTLGPGMYTVGIKLTESGTSTTLADLFASNNGESHMLLVGAAEDMGDSALAGGENWADVANEPAAVGDGALSVSWDETDVATDDVSISIGNQAQGFTPSYIEVVMGTTVEWTNSDTFSHTVTDVNGEFDSGTIANGEAWEWTFDSIGTYAYKCTFHTVMQGTIVVVAAAEANEYARTPYLTVWSADSYLVFWANYDMGTGNQIMVKAQHEGFGLDDSESLSLTTANGYKIMDGRDHSKVGSELTDTSWGEWIPYYIHLTSSSGMYAASQPLQYDTETGNKFSFVFHARGPLGSASIGGVEVVRTLHYGFFAMREGAIQQEIFPSETVTTTFFVKNTGTLANVLQVTPELKQMGYDTSLWQIFVSASALNGAPISTTSSGGTTSVPMDADSEARITMVIEAPDFNWDTNEPLSNRKLTLYINLYDTGSQSAMAEPPGKAKYFIRPPQFSLTGIEQNRVAVQDGDPDGMEIRVTAVNEGNYAKDVQVYFLVYDPKDGDRYKNWSIGTTRATQIGSTVIPKMEPKRVLEAADKDSSYTASFTWTEPYVPEKGADRGDGGDYYDVQVFAWINPDQNEDDLGVIKPCGTNNACDEYDNKKDDNLISTEVSVVSATSTSPSFALGLAGLAGAAFLASLGVALRRREEED